MRGKIKWCLKQKRGLKLVKPNNNLCKEYLDKSRGSLNMLDAAIERGENEWVATTAYYARYFALYALFQKCGIKCEIHDCTINAFNYLFVEKDLAEKELFEAILASKNLRVDAQYYVAEEFEKNKVTESRNLAGKFVIEIERILESLTEKQMNSIRNKVRELANSNN